MDNKPGVETKIGNKKYEFYPNMVHIGGLIAIGISIVAETVITALYLMYSQPGTFEQDLRLGVLKIALVVCAIPALLGTIDLFSRK